jgi:hypothetical protein
VTDGFSVSETLTVLTTFVCLCLLNFFQARYFNLQIGRAEMSSCYTVRSSIGS